MSLKKPILTITRPAISYAVNTLCQFMSSPPTTHLVAVKRILRYVAGTLHHGLLTTPLLHLISLLLHIRMQIGGERL